MRLTAGMSGGARGGAVALADEREVFAACLQELGLTTGSVRS